MSSDSPARLTDRAVIAVTGEEARDFLQRVVTCPIADISDGDLRAGALLTPQGKIVADFLVHGRPDGVLIELPAASAEALAKRLSMYKLRARAEVRVSEDLAVIVGEGTPDPRSTALLPRSIRPRAETEGIAAGDAAQVEAEIAAGVPAFGRDYGDADVFPTDVNLDLFGGIGWKKGCFVGQEVVSRMKRRGTIRKRTVRLDFHGSAPAAGTDVALGDTALGTITSSTGSHALAILRLDRLEDAQEVEAGGLMAKVVLPPNI
jgi:hypothetical protein